jgi:hypothetical protein
MVPKEVEMILARQLASFLALPIFLVGPTGDLIYYNEPAEMILGCRLEETGEMSAQTWATMFKPQDEHGGQITTEMLPLVIAVNLRRPAQSTFWISALDQSRHYIDVTAIPVIGQAERFLGAIAIFWETRP